MLQSQMAAAPLHAHTAVHVSVVSPTMRSSAGCRVLSACTSVGVLITYTYPWHHVQRLMPLYVCRCRLSTCAKLTHYCHVMAVAWTPSVTRSCSCHSGTCNAHPAPLRIGPYLRGLTLMSSCHNLAVRPTMMHLPCCCRVAALATLALVTSIPRHETCPYLHGPIPASS